MLSGPDVESPTGGHRSTVEWSPTPSTPCGSKASSSRGRVHAEDWSRRVHLLRDSLRLRRGVALREVGLQDRAAFEAASSGWRDCT
jgi:hypothetical protein